jgi:AbiJ N-terminal domain 3
MNDDWPDTWIFTDERFGLADNDEALPRFLTEMLHPAVRTDPAEVERLHTFLNSVLVHDGQARSRYLTQPVSQAGPVAR